VLLDLSMPGAAATARAFREAAPEAGIVGIAVAEADDPAVVACAEEGVAGYVPRGASLDELLATVGRVEAGEAPAAPWIVAAAFRRLAELSAERRGRYPGARLTPREQEVAGLLECGLSNSDIAKQLCIELPTVKNHVHNILRKLQVRRRGEAVARLRA